MPNSIAEQFILEFFLSFFKRNTRVGEKNQLCLAQHKTAHRAANEPAPAIWAVDSPFLGKVRARAVTAEQQRDSSPASLQLTLQHFHREDSPGIFQVGNVNIASCIAGQANVQNPRKEKKKKKRSGK